MSDESTEKEHLPSSKRISELKSKGQVLRSKDFTGGLIFILSEITFLIICMDVYSSIKDGFVYSFNSIKSMRSLDSDLIFIIHHVATENLYSVMPFFVISLAAALISPFLFGGWNFTLKSIEFKGSSINPLTNMKRIFSVQILLNIVKSIIKFIIVFGLFVIYLFFKKYEIIDFWNVPLDEVLLRVSLIIKSYMMIMSIGIIIIAVVDVIFSSFEFNKKSMMSSQELKDEYKESEGNVDVKRKLRSMQITLIRNRLSALVPQATVVITNPTHYAIAIRYDEYKDRAPKVLTKGKDAIAKQIREIAAKNGIPIYEAPSLARSIYHTTKIGAQINPGLYMAVAIVFGYIYQLRQYQMGNAPSPKYVTDLKIPTELLYDD